MAHHRHGDVRRVQCAVLTVSDTRTEETDRSGALIRTLLARAGHAVVWYGIVPDDPERVVATLRSLPPQTEAIICNGGTGLGKRDSTYETLQQLLEKEIRGFGELFRMLSYAEIGAAAMLSRATAGTFEGRAVFSLPGSPAAVGLGMEKLILPEIGHIVGLLR